MDTLLRGYNKKETPPQLPVHISLGNVFNSICISGFWRNPSYDRVDTFGDGSNTFHIPDLDLKPGESYTIGVSYGTNEGYVVDCNYYAAKYSAFDVNLHCKYGGCFGNIPAVIGVSMDTVPKNGETKTLTTTYGNALIEFILRNNNWRWNNSIRISPA